MTETEAKKAGKLTTDLFPNVHLTVPYPGRDGQPYYGDITVPSVSAIYAPQGGVEIRLRADPPAIFLSVEWGASVRAYARTDPVSYVLRISNDGDPAIPEFSAEERERIFAVD
jgi:hypothetical protein